ncbi:hypothetical protein [Corynebacterium sp. H113]|uniref:hypothetical protein n=1 Tax=Corynebacterium sp. H113 TaxID=3133419 RepID=UPI0030AD363D
MNHESVGSLYTSEDVWNATVDWLARMDVEEPAAVAVAAVLEELSGPPRIDVWGRVGAGAGVVAKYLQQVALNNVSAASTWQWQDSEGVAGALSTINGEAGQLTWVDARVRVTRDTQPVQQAPGVQQTPAAQVASARELWVHPEECADGERAAELITQLEEIVSAPGARDALLTEALEHIAVSFASRRDDIEALLASREAAESGGARPW